MNLKVYFLSLLTLSVILISCKKDTCATKDDFLNSFETYLEKEQKEVASDTLFFNQEFKDLVNNCYKKHRAELSLDERKDFWIKSLKHFIKDLKDDVDIDLKDSMNDPFNEYVAGEVTNLMKDAGFSFLMEVQNIFKDDIDKLMTLFESELGDFAKLVEQMLQ